MMIILAVVLWTLIIILALLGILFIFLTIAFYVMAKAEFENTDGDWPDPHPAISSKTTRKKKTNNKKRKIHSRKDL